VGFLTDNDAMRDEDVFPMVEAEQHRRNLISNAGHQIAEALCGPRDSRPHKENYPGIQQTLTLLVRDLDALDETEWEEIKQAAIEAIAPNETPTLKTNSYEPSPYARLVRHIMGKN
jgi:hypothetical protein